MSDTRYPDRVEPGFGYRLLVRLRGQKHAPLSRCDTAAQLLSLGAEYVTLLLAAVCFVFLAIAIYGSMPLIVMLPIAVAMLLVLISLTGLATTVLLGTFVFAFTLGHMAQLTNVLRKPRNGPSFRQRVCRSYGEPGLDYAGPDIPWDIRNQRKQIKDAKALNASGILTMIFVAATFAAVGILGTGLWLVIAGALETIPDFAILVRPQFLLTILTGTLGAYAVFGLFWHRVRRRVDEICKHAE